MSTVKRFRLAAYSSFKHLLIRLFTGVYACISVWEAMDLEVRGQLTEVSLPFYHVVTRLKLRPSHWNSLSNLTV